VTKQAFAYAFDRVSGKPIWPIEERPVRRRREGESGLPRSLFQQSPLRRRSGITPDDLIKLHSGPETTGAPGSRRNSTAVYTPPPLATTGPAHPGPDSGSKVWAAARIGNPAPADPERVLLLWVQQRIRDGSFDPNANPPRPLRWVILRMLRFRLHDGRTAPQLPTACGCSSLRMDGSRPPYDMRGHIAWQVPNGDTPPNIKANLARQG